MGGRGGNERVQKRTTKKWPLWGCFRTARHFFFFFFFCFSLIFFLSLSLSLQIALKGLSPSLSLPSAFKYASPFFYLLYLTHKMKLKRHKKVRKVLHFYEMSFGLKPPYRIASMFLSLSLSFFLYIDSSLLVSSIFLLTLSPSFFSLSPSPS